jgi:hypothetical protein
MESMIVLTVFGLLLAASWGNFLSVLRNQRLSGATSQVATPLRLAREKAASEGNSYIVTFRLAVNDYQIWDDESSDIVLGPQDGRRNVPMPDGTCDASGLQDDVTIVANHSIYTKGSFNSGNKRAAAIISSWRIWHVSDAWRDDDSYTQGPKSGRQAASGTTVINAAMVGGQPAVNEANFADLDGNGSPDGPGAGDCRANNDHMLESWGSSRTLQKRGSIVQLQFADRADNVYDTGMSGRPPFAPLVSKLHLWQEVTPWGGEHDVVRPRPDPQDRGGARASPFLPSSQLPLSSWHSAGTWLAGHAPARECPTAGGVAQAIAVEYVANVGRFWHDPGNDDVGKASGPPGPSRQPIQESS